MKHLLTATFLLFCQFAMSQKTEAYYDYNWKPCKSEDARFYSTIEKTDSGWFRNDYFLGTKTLQMQALYEDGSSKIQNGYCYYFHANGVPSSIGRMVHNRREGVWVSYYSNGLMSDSAFYHDGVPVGSRILWHKNGFMSDSIYHANDSMDVHISWFDDGTIASAGYLLNGKAHAKWKFFHHNGEVSAIEAYDKGEVVSKEFFKEDGTMMNDTSGVNHRAEFKGGEEGWKKYLGKNLYWPQGYHFSTGNMAVVFVQLTVNDKGKVIDAEVIVPFHPEFDKIALRAIQDSPDWIPAIQHNRKVKYSFRQPVTFREE